MSTKNDKIFILLEDDTEILGNGQGHVLYRQYLPVVRYIELLKRHGAKSTFYIDMAHMLFLKENVHIKDFALQSELLEKTVLHILDNNMEVQLHLHSQWVNATVNNDRIQVTKKWNIGQLTADEQVRLFHDGLDCLRSIVQKTGKTNPLNSFKAGSWGLQPFNTLYSEFEKVGVKIVLGPIKGLKVPSLDFDYTEMESNRHPYYCDKVDINKIGSEKGPIIIPMTPTYLNWVDLIGYLIQLKYKGFVKRYDKELDLHIEGRNYKHFNPLSGKDKLNLSLRPFQTHLKINSQPFWYLKKTFKRAYKKVLESGQDFRLITIETHTKDFKNTFKDIDKFFNYLSENYVNIEFITPNELLLKIQENRLKPLLKK